MDSPAQYEVDTIFRKLSNRKFPKSLIVICALLVVSTFTTHRIFTGILLIALIIELMRVIDGLYAEMPNWQYFRDRNINIRKGFEEIRLFPELTNLEALKELMPYTPEDFWPVIPLPGIRIGYLHCTLWPNESYGFQNTIKETKNSLTDFSCHLYVTDKGLSMVLIPPLIPSLYHLTFPFESISVIDAKRGGRLLRISLKTDKHFILRVGRTRSYANDKIVKYLLEKIGYGSASLD